MPPRQSIRGKPIAGEQLENGTRAVERKGKAWRQLPEDAPESRSQAQDPLREEKGHPIMMQTTIDQKTFDNRVRYLGVSRTESAVS